MIAPDQPELVAQTQEAQAQGAKLATRWGEMAVGWHGGLLKGAQSPAVSAAGDKWRRGLCPPQAVAL